MGKPRGVFLAAAEQFLSGLLDFRNALLVIPSPSVQTVKKKSLKCCLSFALSCRCLIASMQCADIHAGVWRGVKIAAVNKNTAGNTEHSVCSSSGKLPDI